MENFWENFWIYAILGYVAYAIVYYAYIFIAKIIKDTNKAKRRIEKLKKQYPEFFHQNVPLIYEPMKELMINPLEKKGDKLSQEQETEPENKPTETQKEIEPENNNIFQLSSKMDAETLEFIKKHGITEDELFDASGVDNSGYPELMKKNNKFFAYGVMPCKYGHSFKTRHRHCVICYPSRIAYVKRHYAKGQVYLAKSIESGIIKIGFTSNIESRKKGLKSTNYGGYSDWQILRTEDCDQAGKVERKIHTLLSKHSISKQYQHDSHMQETYELFDCNEDIAYEAMESVLNNYND